MQSMIIVCILLSGGLVTQAQLNYEGSPLTETIDYTAQESQSSRLNAKKDYHRFDIADGRAISLSKISFTPSSVDPLTSEVTKYSSYVDDKDTNYEEQWKKMTREIILPNNGSASIEANHNVRARTMPGFISKPVTDIEPPIESFPEASLAKLDMDNRAETRQLREYPIQYPHTRLHQSLLSQETPQAYHQPSNTYVTPEQSSFTQNLTPHSTNPINQASVEALSQFLNSRTPEESETALQSYLKWRERTSSTGSAQQIVNINDEKTRQNGNQRVNIRDTFDNEISENHDNQNSPQQIDNSRILPAVLSSDSTGQIAYLPRAQYSQQSQKPYPSLRWNQIGLQSRPDNFHAVPSMRRQHLYRGPMRPRLNNHWAQSRVAPGGPLYHSKGSIIAGRPGSSNSLINGHWKQPIEVIYTKPPGPIEPSSQTAIANPPIPYEDASKWFPDSNHEPSQKDIYYSQLYAQSYDPHYYNYIAKTGKIKPWLYGKLGKNEEKSIWWELFSGFKNHGMKNMMNPMFLLGMTIPTLTLMLSALVQKRSSGRADTGIYDPRLFIEKYETQIREALLAQENQTKEGTEMDARDEVKVQKRSVETMSREFEQKARYFNPFESFFLANQDLFAKAILANEKRLMEEDKLDETKEGKIRQSPIGPQHLQDSTSSRNSS